VGGRARLADKFYKGEALACSMKLLRGLIESLTHKGVKTICNPRGLLEGSLAVSTVPENFFRAFVVDRDRIDITESGGFVTSLPKRSNIRDLDPVIDDIIDEWEGWKGSFEGQTPKASQQSWVDGFNRFAATKVEWPEGISYNLRADLANEVSQRGHLLVQCDQSFCDILIPSKVAVDLNRWSVDEEE
jgi:hypothetical protein